MLSLSREAIKAIAVYIASNSFKHRNPSMREILVEARKIEEYINE